MSGSSIGSVRSILRPFGKRSVASPVMSGERTRRWESERPAQPVVRGHPVIAAALDVVGAEIRDAREAARADDRCAAGLGIRGCRASAPGRGRCGESCRSARRSCTGARRGSAESAFADLLEQVGIAERGHERDHESYRSVGVPLDGDSLASEDPVELVARVSPIRHGRRRTRRGSCCARDSRPSRTRFRGSGSRSGRSRDRGRAERQARAETAL